MIRFDRHNDMVQALQVMYELDATQAGTSSLAERPEIIQALQATRESLVSALMTEKILRRHQALINRRQELYAAIESNLIMLKTLQINHQASDYCHFLQEALEIGLSVQQEIDDKFGH
jgi:multidrug efflux pump subunit AcrA (membrane-fusion protein)